jgi:hypothetical protein
VVLDLLKAGFDVIGMDHNVIIQVCNVSVICADDNILSDCTKSTVELGAVWCRCHGVDGDGVPMIFP